MKIIGGLFIAFGIVDFVADKTGHDMWAEWLGIQLPDILYRFSAFIAIGIGYAIIKYGSESKLTNEE